MGRYQTSLGKHQAAAARRSAAPAAAAAAVAAVLPRREKLRAMPSHNLPHTRLRSSSHSWKSHRLYHQHLVPLWSVLLGALWGRLVDKSHPGALILPPLAVALLVSPSLPPSPSRPP